MTEQSTLRKGIAGPEQQASSRAVTRSNRSGWSAGRWLALISGFFVFQLGFAYLVADRPLGGAGPKQSRFIAKMIPGMLTEDRLSQLYFASDPLLFPGVSAHGFSSQGWLAINRPAYELPDEIEPPHWLALRTDSLGQVTPAKPKAALPFELGQQSTPQTEALPVFIPDISPRTNSQVRVDAVLSGRALRLPLKLPSRPSDIVLSNSVIDVAVNGAGEVVARRLAASSGSPEADRDALEQAKLLRFQALNAVGTIWGQAIFEWETAEEIKK